MNHRQDITMNTLPTRADRRTSQRPRTSRRDSGTVLGFVLIFFMFVGLTVVATLSFASTLMRNRPPINERNARVEAVRSGMRMAIQFQRDHGVGDCFQDTQTFTFNAGRPEEATATVTCSIGPVEELSNNYFREGGDAFALVTTMRDGSYPSISGSEDLANRPLKVIEGNVFVGGGDFNAAPTPPRATGADVLVGNETGGAPSAILGTRLTGPRYDNGVGPVTCDDPLVPSYLPSSGNVFGVDHANSFQCTDLEWTERVGTRVAPATTWSYPSLPGIPANNRPVFNPRQFPIGSTACQVIFPGRYDMPINLDSGGEYYLPSGLYYFTKPVTVTNGSTVVAGQGRKGGCEVDSTVLLDPRTIDLEATSITGRGATFLLDEDASVSIDDGQLFMNRRISTPSTRGSEGVSIRAIQTSTINTASLYVPEDQVVTGLDSDGNRILESASSYTIDGGSLDYSGLTAPDVDVPLVTADFRGHSGSAFVVDGNIFVPQGKFSVHADNPNYELSLDGGVVASRAELDISAMPANANDWYFGVDASPLLRRVELVATATVNGKTARSVSSFQVNSVGSYAINSWIVDPDHSSTGGGGAGGSTAGGSTAGGSTAGGSTAGGSTAGGSTAGGSTDGGSTDGGSTDGGSTDGGSTDGGSTDGGSTVVRPMVVRPMVVRPMVGVPMVVRPMVVRRRAGARPHRAPTRRSGPSATGTTRRSPARLPTRSAKTMSPTTGDGVARPKPVRTSSRDVGPRRSTSRPAPTSSRSVPTTASACGSTAARSTTAGSTRRSAPRRSPASLNGDHVIEVDYYEWGGDAQLLMTWSDVPVCAPDQDQWFGQYYNGTSLSSSNLRFDRWDDSPNFDWGNGRPSEGSDNVGNNDTFSISWIRTQNFPGPGTYRFTVGSDDGTRLYVNGNRVINNWNNQSYNQSVRTVEVEIQDPCQVQLELRYYENSGRARVSYDMQQIS